MNDDQKPPRNPKLSPSQQRTLLQLVDLALTFHAGETLHPGLLGGIIHPVILKSLEKRHYVTTRRYHGHLYIVITPEGANAVDYDLPEPDAKPPAPAAEPESTISQFDPDNSEHWTIGRRIYEETRRSTAGRPFASRLSARGGTRRPIWTISCTRPRMPSAHE